MKNKLKTSRGMTIVLALIIFLIVSIICATLLSASLTAAQNAQSQIFDEQAYLSMTSAARLLRQAVEETATPAVQWENGEESTEPDKRAHVEPISVTSTPTPLAVTKVVTYDKNGNYANESGDAVSETDATTFYPDNNNATAFIAAFREFVENVEKAETPDKADEVKVERTITVDNMNDVKLTLEHAKGIRAGGKYNVTATLTVPDGTDNSLCKMQMNFDASTKTVSVTDYDAQTIITGYDEENGKDITETSYKRYTRYKITTVTWTVVDAG